MNINTVIKFFIANFSYGFIRGMMSVDKSKPNELAIERVTYSFINGCIYASPVMPLHLHKLAGRIEIKLTNKNPHEHSYYYQELIALRENYNTL